MHNLKIIFKYMKKYKYRYILGILFLIMVDILSVILPLILRDITNYFVTNSYSTNIIIRYILQIALIGAGISFGRLMWRYLIVGSSKKVEYDYRNDFFLHLEKLSLNFYNVNSTGNLMALSTNDLPIFINGIGSGLVLLLDTFILIIATGFQMFRINTGLTLLSLSPLPLTAFILFKIGIKMQRRYLKVQNAFGKLSNVIEENLSGIRIIQSYNQEESEIEKLNKMNVRYKDLNISYARLLSIFNPILENIGTICYVIFLGISGTYVIIGQFSLGDFIAFNSYLWSMITPILTIGMVINIVQRAIVSFNRLEGIKLEKPDIFDSKTKDIDSLDGSLQIKNLTFTYPKNKAPSLKNININLPKGKILGIVGKTGSGKSTLTNLLIRLYNVPDNRIIINNVDINRIPLNTLRTKIGVVSDTFLFRDTVTENINFAYDNVDMDKIIEASKNAEVYKNIMDFPEKFDTIIGERAVTLSGGQKQRIAIARALIKNPDILILDDCLSAVDSKTEISILNNLKAIMKNKTSIIISHRISSVQYANEIIVLDNGKIVEKGTHEDLIAKKGFYYNIYINQQLKEKLSVEA
ncbi:MAG: ABC transporter ATP-binding protein/permease [Oscillospiraceae bacterium]|nr:ABC transporter ATP-binding protein/permease [Oscillospiraceae bacterium]